MVPLGFNETAVECRQFEINGGQFAREDLEFFTASAFDERTADQVVDDLEALAITHSTHQTGDPGTRIGLSEWDSAPLEQIQHQLEMLELFHGDRVQLAHTRKQIPVFFKVQRTRRRLALQM